MSTTSRFSSRKGKSGGTCEFCGNTYSKREHYQRHVRTHTRERPYSCTECSATFSRRDTLARHARARHPNIDVSRIIGISGTAQNEDTLQTTQSTGFSMNNDSTQLPFPSDPLFGSCTGGNGIFDWSWDDSLNLDPSFSWEDLGTYDLNTASPSLPWLPLRPDAQAEHPHNDTLRPSSRVSQSWFSNMNRQTVVTPWPGSDISAAAGEEISRDALTNSLQQRVPDTNLPSTPFLNRCLHMFTTRLWPLVPIVHLPTFQPARTNPLLLLSICSLGALAIGSEEALYHGERLFEGVQKAILVSFSPNRYQDEHTLAILQAATIGQTYALLSGSPSNLLTAQCFHGTLGVAVKAFHAAGPKVLSANSASTASSDDWSLWIREQTIIRLLNLIYVHNGEAFATVHQPPMLRTHPLQIRVAADDSLFLARTAEEWESLRSRQQESGYTRQAPFSSCAVLDCFVAEIYHRKTDPFSKMDFAVDQEFQPSLVEWLERWATRLGTDGVQRYSLLMIWHSCFILLLCDVDLLERVCGRDGTSTSEEDSNLLQAWASKSNARRCVIHALLIYSSLERFRVADVPAIHVGRVAWQAGLVLAIFSFVSRTEQDDSFADIIATCPELQAIRKTSLFSESDWAAIEQNAAPERCRMTAFSLSAILRHLGPWQNAARFAKTLDQILHLFEPYQ